MTDTQRTSETVVTAPDDPTLEDLVTFYGEGNFRSGVKVRVPYRVTRQALETHLQLKAAVEEICQQRTTSPITRARLRHALAGVDWRKVK
jgi:hypothetical protein